MAITHNTKINASIANVANGAILATYSAIGQATNYAVASIEKMQTKNTLNNLSNRELEDIGISRADIPFVVKEIFSKK